MLSFCLNFYQFQPGVAYKSVALTFYTESDSWIIFDCRNSFNKKLRNLWTSKKAFLIQEIHSLYLKNPFRKNVIRLLVCGPFSPASICKHWTSIMMTQTCSQPSQISKMDYFAIIVNGQKSLTIFAKCFILNIWQGYDYASWMTYQANLTDREMYVVVKTKCFCSFTINSKLKVIAHTVFETFINSNSRCKTQKVS